MAICSNYYLLNTASKVLGFRLNLVFIFPHLTRIQRFTEHISVSSPNTGKHRPEKLWKWSWTYFTPGFSVELTDNELQVCSAYFPYKTMIFLDVSRLILFTEVADYILPWLQKLAFLCKEIVVLNQGKCLAVSL